MIYHHFSHGQRVKAGAHYGTITGILEKGAGRYTFMVAFDHHAARECAPDELRAVRRVRPKTKKGY